MESILAAEQFAEWLQVADYLELVAKVVKFRMGRIVVNSIHWQLWSNLPAFSLHTGIAVRHSGSVLGWNSKAYLQFTLVWTLSPLVSWCCWHLLAKSTEIFVGLQRLFGRFCSLLDRCCCKACFLARAFDAESEQNAWTTVVFVGPSELMALWLSWATF